MKWLIERPKHFLCAIPVGLFLTILAVIGCAFGMEFKDLQYKGTFNWHDIAATVLGGVIGLLILLGLILLL